MDFSNDRLIWDVGHQCYTHKLITGRYDRFDTLRKEGGICGFPRREESDYDHFDTGHAGTSISAALGFAYARDLDKKMTALKEGVAATGSMLCLDDWAVVIGRPVEAHYDEQERLHGEDGPALVMTGGRSFYSWHGVSVPSELVLSPQSLTAEMIRNEKNTETRQVMVDRMGAERFMRELKGKEMHRDSTGVLWRVELTPEIRISAILKRPEHKKLLVEHMREGDIKELFKQLEEDEWRDIVREGEVWQAVEVVNSTAEPDGTFKTYFLSVPPTVSTAREAVAWTFGLSEKEYEPEIEK
jgi:hypothetical protein